MRQLAYALRFSLPVLGGLAAFVAPTLPSRHAVSTAEAGPLRRPRIHTLLVDLTHIEANNGERDDRRTAHAIEQQIVAIRSDLLRAMSGELPPHVALQATLNNLYAIAAQNSRSQDNDYDLVMRVAGSIEQMRLRAEQVLTHSGPHAPPPLPPTYRQPGSLYVPEPYVPPLLPAQVAQRPPSVVVSTPPGYPQQPGYQQPPPGYQQPPPGYQQSPPGYPQQPQPNYQQPPPGYQQPPPGYQPTPGYPQPTPGYQQPPPGYQPAPNYQQPPPGYQPTPAYPPPQPAYQQPAPPPAPMPMPPSQFQTLVNQVKRLAFSDEKINAVQDAVRSGYNFTCEQIVMLMRTSAFGDDQVKIGSLLYPRAVDPHNFSLLTSALTFESDRERLRKACGR